MDGRELKSYERFKAEAQFCRDQNRSLRQELVVCRRQLYRADARIDGL